MCALRAAGMDTVEVGKPRNSVNFAFAGSELCPGSPGTASPFESAVRTTVPGLVAENSMGGSPSGTSPQKLSPVVSAECALFVPGKMLSRMGSPGFTQPAPEAVVPPQFQS